MYHQIESTAFTLPLPICLLPPPIVSPQRLGLNMLLTFKAAPLLVGFLLESSKGQAKVPAVGESIQIRPLHVANSTLRFRAAAENPQIDHYDYQPFKLPRAGASVRVRACACEGQLAVCASVPQLSTHATEDETLSTN